MTSNDIRKHFLDFFGARGHRVLPSSSLVPAYDPTLLFSNAGMNQFKDVFLGREKRDYARAATSQKCVRAGGKHNDLEQVGRTTRHHTFFEMLGNFSFGDYFKKEAIPWAWELVTKDYAIPAEKLYVTVFREDDEAAEIWATEVGVARDRIFRLDEHDNFWAMGDTGPCGPCSEIHFDLGPAASTLGHSDCPFPCPQDCGRYVELWNLVFMQFNRDEGGNMTPLPRPSIDTGAGLERLATVLQGKISNYDTDLFRPLIEEAAGLANVEYGANHDTDVSLRIIADHARAATFLISDGVLPSNEGRGYVLRLIMRRALYHGQTLGLNEPFLYKMAGHVVQMMKDAYPELAETERHVAKAVKVEEERYAHSTRLGLGRLETVPVVVSSGEELPFYLARRLDRPISTHTPYAHDQGSSLWDTFERRHNIHATHDERAAYEELKSTWSRNALSKRVLDWVLTRLPEGLSKQYCMDDFRMTVGQEVGNLSPYLSFRRAVQRIQERHKGNPHIREALDSFVRRLPPQNVSAWIPGDELFKLHDTFGLRPEFIEDLVNVYGFAVDREGYEAEMQKQRERARASWKAVEKKAASPVFLKLAEERRTVFDGYAQTTSTDCRIVALVIGGRGGSRVAQTLTSMSAPPLAIYDAVKNHEGHHTSSPPSSDERLGRPDLRKASGFPANADPSSSSAPAGRLSLPAGAEEVAQEARPAERQSLSASQAAQPQAVPGIIEHDSKMPGSPVRLPLTALSEVEGRTAPAMPPVISVEAVGVGEQVEIVLDHTPFYAEAGGQVGDVGHFFAPDSDHEVAHITDTYYPVSGLIVHKAVARDTLRVGDLVTAKVGVERRDATRRNHTATHLLHAALRKTLGTHVKQAGSLVAPDRLRFDFTHYAALDEQDLLDIEDLVNERILKNEEVVTTVMDLDGAVSSGAMALFGEKYADQVRVLSINDFSKELCGGTHVGRTGDIGLFKIISESSVAAGTRRIEAVTGEGVLKQLREAHETLALLADSVHAKPEELLPAVEKLTESEKKLRKELEAQQMKRAASQADDLAKEAREVKGVRVVSARVEVTDRAAMRQMVDDLRAKLQSGVIVLGSVSEGKVSLVAAVTKDLTNKLDAGKIVKQAAAIVEGSGGGRKDLAEAGGKNPARLDESLQAVPAIIEAML
jgi:alanyl-tRNA synthetase